MGWLDLMQSSTPTTEGQPVSTAQEMMMLQGLISQPSSGDEGVPQGYAAWDGQLVPTELTPWEEAQMEMQLRQQNFSEWEIKQKIAEAKQQRMMESQQFQQQMGFGQQKFDWQKEVDEANMEIAKRRQKLEQDRHKLEQWEAYRQMGTAPKDQWIQSGLLSEGKVPAPPEWLSKAGIDVGYAKDQRAAGKDWTTQAKPQRMGVQDWSQMPSEQKQMLGGLSRWQGGQSISPLTSGYMSQSPQLARKF